MLRSGIGVGKKVARTVLGVALTIVDWTIQLVGPALSSAALLLIMFVTWVYFTEILPGLKSRLGPFQSNMMTGLGLWLLFNIVFNHISCMFTSPGFPPKTVDEASMRLLAYDPELQDYPLSRTHRYCNQCARVKPMRAHHCSICKRCVMKMDHHCPWVNNCVGYRNHKYFMMFLVHLLAGALFFLGADFNTAFGSLSDSSASTYYLIATILCLSACFAASLFLFWNIYLMCTNQSTVEFYGNNFNHDKTHPGNAFKMDWRTNLEEVFGKGPILLWFLPNWRGPAGDGVTYPMTEKYKRYAQSSRVLVQQHTAP